VPYVHIRLAILFLLSQPLLCQPRETNITINCPLVPCAPFVDTIDEIDLSGFIFGPPVATVDAVPRFADTNCRTIQKNLGPVTSTPGNRLKNSLVRIDDEGNVELNGIIKNGIQINWPSTIGAAGTFLESDGTGNLIYAFPPGGSGGNVDTAIPFTAENLLVRTDTASGDTNIQESGITLDNSNNISNVDTLTATTVIANLIGNATTATTATTALITTSAIDFTGSLAGDVTGTQGATVVSLVDGVTAALIASGANAANAATSANVFGTIVKRDAAGNFSANDITATLLGNATTATTSISTLSAIDFTGSLVGDVTGTQGATVVSLVDGVTAAHVASGANAANNATSANIPLTIVARDAAGNFSATDITATLLGNATTATSATTAVSALSAIDFTGPLSGDVRGTQGATVVSLVDGVTAANIASGATAANNATSANVFGTIVKRDAAGNFSATDITATLLGNATTATTSASAISAIDFTGPLIGDVTGTQGATVVSLVNGVTAASIASGATAANNATSANVFGTIVKRDAAGNFSATDITATLLGNATTATSATTSISALSAIDFTGPLVGDVTGTQGATVVAFVDGVTAANVASGVNAANAATSANIPLTIVKRDAAGNFSATDITATLLGNATTATSATTSISALSAIDFTGPLVGDVTGTQGATAVALVNGVTAANIASGATAANAATSANTFGTIVKRDGSGDFSATTITASLTGAASLNVLKAGDSMSGDLTMLDQTAVIFQDAMADHNFVGVQAPTTVTASYTLALPTTTPTANQVLTAGPTTPTDLVWVTDGGSTPPADSNTIYVTTYGNDTTGTGSFTSPYLTLAKAISTANGISTPSTILVGTGTFVENNSSGPLTVMANNLSIVGESPIATTIMPNTPTNTLLLSNNTILFNRIAFMSSLPEATGISLTGGNFSNFNAVRIINFQTGVLCAGATSSYSFVSTLFMANGTGLSLNNTSAECDDCTISGAASLAGPPANTGINLTGSGTNLVINGGACGLCSTGINVNGSAALTANSVVFKRNTFPIVETGSAQMTLTGCTFAIPMGTSPIDIQVSGAGTTAEIIGCEFNGTNALGVAQGTGIAVTGGAEVDIGGGNMHSFTTGLQVGTPTDTSSTVLTASAFVIRTCAVDILQQGTSTLDFNASIATSSAIMINSSANVNLAYFDVANNDALTIGSSSNLDTILLQVASANTPTPSLDYQPSLYGTQAIGLINPEANPSSWFVLSTEAADLTAITTNNTDTASVRLVSDTGTPVGGTSALRGWDITKNASTAELSFNYQNTDTTGQAVISAYDVMQISGVANQLQFPNANTQIVFSGDTNLFRSSADVLATTSNFIVAPLTPGTVVITDPTTNELSSSITTSTELSYLSGTTSSVQTQLNNKLPLTGGTLTGTLTLPAGTTSSPSLTFTGSSGAGLSSNSGNLSFSTNGSEQMQIASDGTIYIDSFTVPGVVHNGTENLYSALVTGSDIAPNANIANTQLAIITTPGYVANSATTATSANVASTIVQRDASGNFAANNITAIDSFVGDLTGTASEDVPLAGGTMTGTLVLPAGATNSPSLQFSGSSGTGISAPAFNTLSFDTAGAEAMSIDPLGNVTIDNIGTGVVHANSGLISASQIINADIATATITNDKLANISSSNIPGDIVVRDSVGDFITNMITITGTPTNPTDVATVSFVNSAISTGLVAKTPAIVVATSDITLAGAQTIDSIFVSTNDRVLAVAQTSAVDNGIWLVQNPGAWTYPTDWVPGTVAAEAYVLILQGAVYGGSSWLCSTPEAIIGLSAVDFVEFSLPNQITAANQGTGAGQLFIDKTGNTLNFKTIAAGTHIDVINDATDVTIATDATSANTFGTIVSRDSVGDFIATNITANLTGSASNNVLKAGDSMTGDLNMLMQTSVNFYDVADDNYVGIQGPTTLPASYTLSLPPTTPIAHQVMRANATIPTNLEWVTDGGSVPPAMSETIYVTKYGNDTTGDGSFTTPYLTLLKAVDIANGLALSTNPICIVMSAGIYTEDNSSGPISINVPGISIVGDSEQAIFIEPSTSSNGLLVANAPVLIATVSFQSSSSTAAGISLTTTSGTFSTLRNIQLMNFDTGIVCSGGATSSYILDGCTCIGNGTGLEVNNTFVECNNCTVVGATSIAGSPVNTGVTITGASGNLIIEGGSLILCETGLDASNSAVLTASSISLKSNTFDIVQTGGSQMTLTGCSFEITDSPSDIDIQMSGSQTSASIIGCQFNGDSALGVPEATGIVVTGNASLDMSGGGLENYTTGIQVGTPTDTISTSVSITAFIIQNCATAILQQGASTLNLNASSASSDAITISNSTNVSLAYFDLNNGNALTIGSESPLPTDLIVVATGTDNAPSIDYQPSLYNAQAIGLMNSSPSASTWFVLATDAAAELTAITTNNTQTAGVRLVSDTGTPVGGTSALRGWDINKNASSAELSFNYQNTDTTGQIAIAEYNVMQISGVANQLQFPNANTQIVFSGDTNLFRTAADVLATTSNFIVGPLTPGTVVITDPTTNELSSSVTTSTELSYLSGTTSSVQTQLNNKLSLSGGTLTGPLTLPAGSTSIPSLQFTGNGTLNTGLSSPAQNTISFDINGSEAMNISSAGNLTIDNLTVPGVLHNNNLGNISSALITNADVAANAGIVDTKLAVINTPGQVANSATTATSGDAPSTIVLRDTSGNFTANDIAADGTITLGSPLTVANGGTGASTLTGVLIGNGTSAVSGNPITQYNVLIGGLGNAITSVTPSATAGIPLISGGSAANPSFGTAVVAGGGTGATTLNAHGVLLGEGTSPIVATAVGTNGQVLIGSSGADPAFATLTSTSGTISFSPGPHSLSLDVTAGATIDTIAGNTGTASGATVTITTGAGNTQGTALFTGSGSTLTQTFTTATNNNTGIGLGALTSVTGTDNTAFGSGALHANTSASNNTAVGFNALANATSGTNTALGASAGASITSGTANVILGTSAGSALTTGSSNIDILNTGVAGESGVIRIGTPGTQNSTYIAGITGVNVGSSVTSVATISTSSQLGSATITPGPGITVTPAANTITIASSLGLPVTVANGGTGDTNLPAHGVLIGEGTNPVNVTAAGTAGQVFLGNSATTDPTWVSPTAGNGLAITSNATTLSYAISAPISVANGGTGDTTLPIHSLLIGEGIGAIGNTGTGTAGQIIISGGSSADPAWVTPTAGTGLAIIDSASALTYALSTPVTVANGGTGASTLTGVLIGSGTSPIAGNPITQFDVLVGGSGNAITSVAPSATSGIPLISGGSAANPSFGTAVVAGGGTGATTFTPYAVLTGGTTATGPIQSIAGVGTAGQILTSNGPSALPTFQPAATSSISITGNTGGTLTGNTFIFTGGSTGLTFAGSAGTTETLGGTLVVANGGTGATTLTAHGVLLGEGTSAVSSTVAGTAGQLLLGTGTDPIWVTPTAGAGLTIVDSSSALSYALTVPVTVANGGTGDTTLAVHSLLIGEGTGAIANTGPGTAGQIIISGGSSADPAWVTPTAGTGLTIIDTSSALSYALTVPVTVANGGTGASTLTGVLIGSGTSAVTGNPITQFDVLVGGSGNAITSIAPSATAGIPLISGGSAANPSFGTAVVAGGGTGATTLNAHGVLLGEGTSPIVATAVGTNGQVLIGAGGSDPAFATLTSTTGTISFSPGPHSLSLDVTAGATIDTIAGNTGSASGSTVTITTGANNAQGTALFTGAGSTLTETFTTAAGNNTGIGLSALDSLTTGINNTAFGSGALNLTTSGTDNTAFGTQALQNNLTASNSTAVGYQSLLNATGTSNTALGSGAGSSITSGTYNVVLGAGAGSALTTGSSNIDILSAGVAGESGVIRIGTPGTQNSTYISGITGVSVGSVATVATVASTGQLGEAAITAGTGITVAPTAGTITVGLTTPVSVANGGTGASTLTGVLIGSGTSPIVGNPITQFDVLIGGSGNAITSVAPSTTAGIPLISGGSAANPSFGTAVVAGGGTGATTFTPYAVLTGGTAATGPVQSIASVGTSGQILTSNGAGALPTFQAPAASSISITGNSGTITGNAFTITTGAANAQGTALFTGSGSTLTHTFTTTTGNNTGIGLSALDSLAGGFNNTAFGSGALNLMTTGTDNTAVGYEAMQTNINSSNNTAIGYQALTTLTGSAGNGANTAVGMNSMKAMTSGVNNTAIGYGSLTGATTAGENAAFGFNVFPSLASGTYNMGMGINSGTNYTGAESSNIIINAPGQGGESNVLRIGTATGTGVQDLAAAYICGIQGVSIGSSVTSVVTIGGTSANQLGEATITAGTGIAVTPGASTITIGLTTPVSVANGGTGDTTLPIHSLLIGEGTGAIGNPGTGTAGQIIVSGGSTADPAWVTPTAGTGLTVTENATTHSYALTVPVTVANGGTGDTTLLANAVLLGNGTGAIATTGPGLTGQVLTGVTSGAPTFQTPAASSISITGNSGTITGAAFTITTGAANAQGTALFTGAGSTLTETFTTATGNNTGIGLSALDSLTSGTGNTAFGSGALNLNTTGSTNTAVGTQALQNNLTASNSTALGFQALQAATGTSNTALGSGAGAAITTGTTNVVLGAGAGSALTTGSSNIDILSTGVAGESGVIRIGTPGTQNSTYISGITGVSVGSVATVATVASTGQLGEAAITAGTGITVGTAANTITVGLTAPVSVANGGTGASTLTGVLIGSGTSPIVGNPITQFDVLVGGSGNAITSVAPSTTAGIPLISGGSAANPSFETAVVAGGGTGATTFTPYAVLTGGTAATGPVQSIASVGTSGQILTSNGAGALPTFQAPAASSISITGNTGGALTGNAFTFTGGSTGLTFAGSGTTETLGGTLVVANGGTGDTTLPIHSLLIGEGTGAIGNPGTGTAGQIIVSGGSTADPAWVTPTAGTGLTVTENATTHSYALTVPVTVANGGTGDTTLLANAVLLGNGTSAIATTGPGLTGQVLTGVTSGAPTFQTPAASSISITGNTGTVTGAAFTITTGAANAQGTALFTGSGSTLTETFTTATGNNTGLGLSALDSLSTGTGNTAFGSAALNLNTTGPDNTAVGTQALQNNTTGTGNVAVGYQALQNNTTVPSSTAVGYQALQAATNGGTNTALGYQAGSEITTGEGNILVGVSAGGALTSGNFNIGIGNSALTSLSSLTGVNNIAIGNSAGSLISATGANNIYINNTGSAESNTIRIGTQGSGGGQQNATYIAGITGVSVGSVATVATVASTGQLGEAAITAGTGITVGTAANTITVGLTAPVSVANGGTGDTTLLANAVLLGNGTGAIATTAVGTTGQVLTGVTGSAPTFQTPAASSISITGNTGTVTGAAFTITTGAANAQGTALFTGSGSTLTQTFTTAAGNNTGIGLSALDSLTTGTAIGNTAFGSGALNLNTTGTDNTAVGTQALQNNLTTSSSTAVGYQALHNATGASNTALGATAGSSITSGTFNVVLGAGAGSALTTGVSNIDILSPGVAGESGVIRIGVPGTQNSTYISGISGATVIGTAVLCSTAGQLGTVSSARRFKENIKPISDETAYAFMKLSPVRFSYKIDDAHATQYGFVAEEVEEHMPELVVYDEDGNVYTVASHLLYALLLDRIKRDHAQLQELKARIEVLEARA
jgi:hypothetical protein